MFCVLLFSLLFWMQGWFTWCIRRFWKFTHRSAELHLTGSHHLFFFGSLLSVFFIVNAHLIYHLIIERSGACQISQISISRHGCVSRFLPSPLNHSPSVLLACSLPAVGLLPWIPVWRQECGRSMAHEKHGYSVRLPYQRPTDDRAPPFLHNGCTLYARRLHGRRLC